MNLQKTRVCAMAFLAVFLATAESVFAEATTDKQETKDSHLQMSDFRKAMKPVENFIQRVGGELGKAASKTADFVREATKKTPTDEKK